jgi:hypothetical protein
MDNQPDDRQAQKQAEDRQQVRTALDMPAAGMVRPLDVFSYHLFSLRLS